MFFKKEVLYFVDTDSKICGKIKNPKMIPRKGEMVIFGSEKKRYDVIQVIYTYEKNVYTCWVYVNQS